MAKDGTVETQEQEDLEELTEVIEESSKAPGRTPKDLAIFTREFSRVMQSLRFAGVRELAIGSYFVPYEGQVGIEGIVNGSAALMNEYVQAGWQPWHMATPYPGEFSFNLGGQQTGVLNGQWITIIWALPMPEPT